MVPSNQFTVEVRGPDDVTTEVLTRQLRVDLRALGGMVLEPVFAPLPIAPETELAGLPVPDTTATDYRPGVIAVAAMASGESVKGLFELLAGFVHRTDVVTVTVRTAAGQVSLDAQTHVDATSRLAELDRLLSGDRPDD